MSSTVVKPFGSSTPFAEPAWYSALHTPHYTEKHRKLRAFLRERNGNFENHEAWEAAGQVPKEVIKAHAKLSCAAIYPPASSEMLKAAGVEFPAGIHRDDWDIWCDIILIDEGARSGYLGVAWGMGGGNGIGAPPLVSFGTHAQQMKFLVPILNGEKRTCLGITEASGGSDVANLKTTAIRTADGKHYLVNGSKKWITNGIDADYITAAVRTGGPGGKGISMLIIDLNSPGVTRRKITNTGVNASGSAYLEFEDVLVPVENLLGEEGKGFAIIMTNFLHERLSLCVQANRMSRICIEDAYEYAVDRSTFGTPLITKPLIRAKLADMARAVENNQAQIEAIAYHMTQVPKAQADMDLAGSTALLKVSCTRALEFCNREALQILGGIGYQRGGRGGRIEQIGRDLRVMAVGGGSDEIMGDLGLRMAEMLAKSKSML